MIIAHLKPQQRERAMRILFGTSQIALILAMIGQRFATGVIPGWFPLDFVFGLFIGVSIAGNLASLVYFRKRISYKGGISDDRED